MKTLSTVSFHALSPCLVFDQIVSSHVGLSQSWRVVAFCLLITARLAWSGLPKQFQPVLMLDDRRRSFLLVVMSASRQQLRR
ncbi:MAG: hypothetical protein U0Q11_24750 [Vicinamibacterales bacterium]